MGNNIAVSVTADVAELQVKRAVLSAELRTAQKDLNDFAKTASKTGMTDGLKADMLAAADSLGKTRNQINLVDKDLAKFGAGAAGAKGALEGLHVGSAGVTRELIVLGREASRGNFSRMAGSATILVQRMGLLTPAVLGTGAAIAALAAPIALFLIAAEQGSQQLARFQNAMAATNGYAGVTISQLQAMAKETAAWAHEGVGAATKELMALAASGEFTGKTLQLVGDDATKMAQLTGESADKWNAEYAKMSQGVAKFAAEYQAKYGQLSTAQFQYILQLEQQGKKETAEYALAKDIYDYLGNQAPAHLGILQKTWKGLGDVVSTVWGQMQAVGRDSNADQIAMLQAKISQQGALGLTAKNSGYVADLQQRLSSLRAIESVSETIAGWQGEATARQKEGVAAAQKLHEQFEASKTSGEKLKAVLADIDTNLAKAVAADPGNRAVYEREAEAARAQARKSDAPSKAPDIVQQWEAELQKQTIASQDFFADETRRELTFWQSKLALTQDGSKQQLTVKTKIFEAEKTLAHQAYDEQLATLNRQLEADKDNWSKERADWDAKLAFIKGKQGEKSKAYIDAQRELQAAERQHQQRMAQIARDGAQQAIADLKNNLETQKQLRQENAQAEEQLVQERARYAANPLAEIFAAQQIGDVHRRLLEQELADDRAYHASQSKLLDQEISSALAAYGKDSEAYQKAIDAKTGAEQQFANQVRVLQNRLVVQSQQDALKVQQAWHNAIDPVVQSFGSGIEGMIRGTETLTQALDGVGETILNVVITAIERWVAAQIVAMITGQATGKTAAAAQIANNIALAGSGGVASMAAAPFPLDLGAPAFGAAMAAQATMFGALASFDVGTNFVPRDMVAQIHEGERVIPAADNAAIMSALSGSGRPGANPFADGGAGGGGVHHWTIHAMDAASFEDWINRPATAGVMRRFAERSDRNLQTGRRA